MSGRLTRRDFLRTVPAAIAGTALLAACGATSEPTPAPIVTSPTASGAIATATSPPASSVASASAAATATTASPSLSPTAASPSLSPTAAPAVAGGTPVRGGTFTYGTGKLPLPVIHPHQLLGSPQLVILDALFLRLVYGREWGDGLNPQSSGPLDLVVAEKMTEVEKDRVWDVQIRQSVKWHDGKPVTADDVIYGVWLGNNKDAKPRATWGTPYLKGAEKLKAEGGTTVEVEGLTKLGEYAVRIELERAVPNYWTSRDVAYWPIPKHIYGQLPLDKVFAEPYATKPVGNGPFRAVRYVDGQYFEMEANPDFYLGRPHLDKFIVRFGDSAALTAALESQEIDGTDAPAGPIYDRLVGLPYLVGNPVPRPFPNGFAVNNEQIQQGGAVNKAIMHAIDVATLSKQLYSNTLVPTNYLFGHVTGLEQPPPGFPKYNYDPGRAQAILREAGWNSSRELRWMMWSNPGALQDAMQAMLAAVGINAKYKVIDAATVTDQLYRGTDWDLVFANFGGVQDMETNWKYIKCGWKYDDGGFNYARYCNEGVDKLWEQALAETDGAKRKALFDQVSMKLAENPPQATLWQAAVNYVYNKRVKGAYPFQDVRAVRPALERLWIDKG